MDWNVFSRSRAGWWGWILTPLLLVALVHFSALACERRAIRLLEETRALNDLIPALERAAGDADAALTRYSSRPVAEAEEVGADFTRLAQEAGVLIDELAIQPAAAPSPDLRCLSFTVVGAGRLPEILRFLADVQYDGRLLELTQISLRRSDVAGGAFYESRMVVAYRALVRAAAAAGEAKP